MTENKAVTGSRLSLPLLMLAIVTPLIIALAHDIARPYTVTPDADIIYMGEALRALDGRPYLYTDHPGYSYTLALTGWLKLLSVFHVIPKAGLGEAIAAPSIDAYMQAMIWAGRWLSALTASLLVAATAGLVRLGGAPPLTAALFALMLACSTGVAHQVVILRAELMSGGFAFLAFCAMGVAARRAGWHGALWLFLSGLAAMLAMQAKVQALIPLLALPPLALALDALKAPCSPGRDDWRVMPLGLVAMVVCAPLAVIIPFSMADSGDGKPYQILMILWIAGGMAAYSRLNDVSPRGVLLAVLALGTGFALGFDVLFLRHSHRVMDAIVNPVEHMRTFAVGQVRAGLFQTIMDIMPAKFETMAVTNFPLRVSEAAALAGAAWLWRLGEKRASLHSVMLVGAALGIEIIFGLSGVPPWYLIYIEPWAFAALLVPLTRLLSGRFNLPVVAVVAAFVMWTGARALAPGVVTLQPLSNVCSQADTYLEPELAVRFHPTCRSNSSRLPTESGAIHEHKA
jgi:hypothetical protein